MCENVAVFFLCYCFLGTSYILLAKTNHLIETVVYEMVVLRLNCPVGVVVKDIAIGAGGLEFDSWAGQIGCHDYNKPAARHRCDISVLFRLYAA